MTTEPEHQSPPQAEELLTELLDARDGMWQAAARLACAHLALAAARLRDCWPQAGLVVLGDCGPMRRDFHAVPQFHFLMGTGCGVLASAATMGRLTPEQIDTLGESLDDLEAALRCLYAAHVPLSQLSDVSSVEDDGAVAIALPPRAVRTGTSLRLRGAELRFSGPAWPRATTRPTHTLSVGEVAIHVTCDDDGHVEVDVAPARPNTPLTVEVNGSRTHPGPGPAEHR